MHQVININNRRAPFCNDAYAIQTRVDEDSKGFLWTNWVIPEPVPVSGANLYDQWDRDELRYLGEGSYEKKGVAYRKHVKQYADVKSLASLI